MKYIEFIIYLILDVLLLIYLLAYLFGYVPEAPGSAKTIFILMCILALAGTRITYKEAKEG